MTCPFLLKNSSKLLIAAPHPLGLGVFSSPGCKIRTAPQLLAAPSATAATRRPQQHNSRQRMLLNLANTVLFRR